MTSNPLTSTLFLRVWLGVMTLMAITGMGQMPIFKRYYIADIPGLAWLAEPYTVHWVHYAGAIVLMAMAGWAAAAWFTRKHKVVLTRSGVIRVALFLLIIVTGYMRVAKNLPNFHWSPLTTVMIDWLHLIFAMGLGGAAIAARITHSKAYVRVKTR